MSVRIPTEVTLMYAELKLRRSLTLLLTAGCLALTSRTPVGPGGL